MAEGMEIIRRITPEEEYNAGLVIFRQGGVHPLEDENGFLRYAVDGDPRRIVRVGATTKLSGRCSCDFFGNVHKPCRHLAAAMMQAISCLLYTSIDDFAVLPANVDDRADGGIQKMRAARVAGDFRPGVRGEGNVVSAIARGDDGGEILFFDVQLFADVFQRRLCAHLRARAGSHEDVYKRQV